MNKALLPWNDFDTGIVIAFLSIGIGFSTYWFQTINPRTRSFFFRNFPSDWQWVSYIGWQRLTGFILMGVIPSVAMSTMTNYTIGALAWRSFNLTDTLSWTVPMTALILPLTYFATRREDSLRTYPQMRVSTWRPVTVFVNSMTWFLYLLGYEMLFRGILFTVCLDQFGFLTALSINLTLYAVTHIPKGASETMGSFLYGTVVCLATVVTGNILVAVVTHVAMALSNDYFSVLHSKEMKFVFTPVEETVN